MPKLTKETLRAKVKRRELAAVYVLHGAETFLRDSAAKTLSNLAFGESDLRDFNDTQFSLNDPANLKDALAAADQLPMMASRRVIRITDVRIASTSARDTVKEEYEQLLAGYLADPSPSTVVVFVADEFNGVRKMAKLLDKHAEVVEFLPLQGRDLTDWIDDRFKKAGVEPEPVAIRHLAAISGSDLRRLSNEVAKLAAAVAAEGKVTVDLINELVPRTLEMDNFALTDHLIAGRSGEAVSSLEKMLEDGAEPLALLGLISYNYRRLLMAKEMMTNGADRSDVARVVKLRYNSQEPFLAAARRANISQLLNAIDRIAATDLAIKTSLGGGTGGARMQIEMLVCELAANS